MSPLRCKFNVMAAQSDADTLVINDVGPHSQYMTVTNDAERVVAHLHKRGDLPPARRLLYYDSEGELGQLRHDGAGKFLGYAPADL
jgi:hypothetical protein